MNSFCQNFKIKFPIIQAGMVWCSGWKLASAVAKNGGLGVIGAGSMSAEVLEEHLQKMLASGCTNFAVNLPLFYPHIDNQIALIFKYKVPIVITSAGNPMLYTSIFKSKGVKVLHVVANLKFALKSIEAGTDGIIAEGFEAGGHNGKDELTTMTLIPLLKKHIGDFPIVAAGGIASGESMYAAMALGANAVQIGSRFAICKESSAHPIFKNAVIQANESDTRLTLKELTPVRLLNTPFYQKIIEAYQRNATKEDLQNLLGKGRAKKGIFEGNWEEGEFEIGQVSAYLNKLETVEEIFEDLKAGFNASSNKMLNEKWT